MSLVTVTDSQVFTALSAWVQSVLGIGQAQVVLEMVNRVPMPNTNFIVMNHINKKRLSTTRNSYTDTTLALEESVDYVLQLDAYGPSASDWASTLELVFRSSVGCDFFDTYGFAPLYTEDALHVQFVNGENQYEERWTLRVHLQINPTVVLAVQTANAVKVDLVTVAPDQPVPEPAWNRAAELLYANYAPTFNVPTRLIAFNPTNSFSNDRASRLIAQVVNL